MEKELSPEEFIARIKAAGPSVLLPNPARERHQKRQEAYAKAAELAKAAGLDDGGH